MAVSPITHYHRKILMLATLRIGYGITVETTPALEKAIEEQIDLEFILADHFPLLALGDYGNTYEVNSLAVVKSSVMESDEYMLELPETDNQITPEETDELIRFCKEYDIEYNPRWLAYLTAF